MSQTMEQTDVGSTNQSEETEKKLKSRRPPNTAFRQQRLKAWQPILTPKTVLPLFFAIGVIFAPIGGLLLYASAKVQEISLDYSDCNATAPDCATGFDFMPSNKVSSYFKNATSPSDAPKWCRNMTTAYYGVNGAKQVATPMCHIQFYIPDTLRPPVLLYYKLTNFYQNHRRYVKSFDQDQLAGKPVDQKTINGSDCDPLRGELQPDGTYKSYYPCGLIANSLFNDTILPPVWLNVAGGAAPSGPNSTYDMTTRGIAWSSDAKLYETTQYNYGDVVPPPNWRVQYPTYNETFPFPPLHTDEAFQVWMRTAGLPTFSKLALRNDTQPMQIGLYEIDVLDNFPVTLYQGTKSILISTRTVMGGKNPFLGIAYLVVGGICILLGALFTVTQLIRPRKLGDHSYLSWNTDQPSTATTSGRAPRPGEGA